MVALSSLTGGVEATNTCLNAWGTIAPYPWVNLQRTYCGGFVDVVGQSSNVICTYPCAIKSTDMGNNRFAVMYADKPSFQCCARVKVYCIDTATDTICVESCCAYIIYDCNNCSLGTMTQLAMNSDECNKIYIAANCFAQCTVLTVLGYTPGLGFSESKYTTLHSACCSGRGTGLCLTYTGTPGHMWYVKRNCYNGFTCAFKFKEGCLQSCLSFDSVGCQTGAGSYCIDVYWDWVSPCTYVRFAMGTSCVNGCVYFQTRGACIVCAISCPAGCTLTACNFGSFTVCGWCAGSTNSPVNGNLTCEDYLLTEINPNKLSPVVQQCLVGAYIGQANTITWSTTSCLNSRACWLVYKDGSNFSLPGGTQLCVLAQCTINNPSSCASSPRDTFSANFYPNNVDAATNSKSLQPNGVIVFDQPGDSLCGASRERSPISLGPFPGCNVQDGAPQVYPYAYHPLLRNGSASLLLHGNVIGKNYYIEFEGTNGGTVCCNCLVMHLYKMSINKCTNKCYE